MTKTTLKFVILCFLLLKVANGLIGYDCTSGKNNNITTISLREVEECHIPDDDIRVEDTYIQLLQLNDYVNIGIIQCKIEVHRTIYNCDDDLRKSVIINDQSNFIYNVDHQICNEIHQKGVLRLDYKNVIRGIESNASTIHNVTFAGFVNGDGTCTGESYSDRFGSWDSVLVTGTLKLTIKQSSARMSLSDQTVILNSGSVCSLSVDNCLDPEGGHTFWDAKQIDNCQFNNYDVLYEGMAKKLRNRNFSSDKSVFTLVTQDVTFSLSASEAKTICGYAISNTEHPKLYICETTNGKVFNVKPKLSISNLDIFTYANSKFVYVKKQMDDQIKSLYKDVMFKMCNLKRNILQNTLSLAISNPDDFSYDLMKGPGYMAVRAGEVVHIVECVPVEVSIKHSNNCYVEMEVTRNNISFFLAAKTRILKANGTRIPCNPRLPALYYIDNDWHNVQSASKEITAKPIILKPMAQLTWAYHNTQYLASSGIYTERDLKELQDKIFSSLSKATLLNNLIGQMHLLSGLPDKETIVSQALNSKAIDEIIDKVIENVWSHLLLQYGTYCRIAILSMCIFATVYVIKRITEIIIQGYVLHDAYGRSLHLFGALCSSITYLLLYLKRIRNGEANLEMMTRFSQVANAEIDDIAL